MFFALFCILPQETKLQIETGRQRDPKESWREETHRSFYPHTHTRQEWIIIVIRQELSPVTCKLDEKQINLRPDK